MIKAVIFNWSGTLSDYGGRGRQAWYGSAGDQVNRLATIWPHHAKTITTLKPGVLTLLQFLKVNQIPYATVTSESTCVLAELVHSLVPFDLAPQVNVAQATKPLALTQALAQLHIDNQAQVLGVFDASDWLKAAQVVQLNTIGLVIGSRLIGLSAVAWRNLSSTEQKHWVQRIRTHFTQLGVENTLADAHMLTQLIKQTKPLEVP